MFTGSVRMLLRYTVRCGLWASHASVKIAGGTYDAGKTYSLCAYIDKLAMKYGLGLG